MNYNEYDYILVLENINEAITDPRNFNKNLPGIDYNPQGQYIGAYDPKISASWAFGKTLQRDLSSMGAGYSCSVFDCGGEVSVTITYSAADTGKSVSKSFIIVFGNKNGDGIIKSSSTRWRSISGIGQAESYIKSVASNLASYANSR